MGILSVLRTIIVVLRLIVEFPKDTKARHDFRVAFGQLANRVHRLSDVILLHGRGVEAAPLFAGSGRSTVRICSRHGGPLGGLGAGGSPPGGQLACSP